VSKRVSGLVVKLSAWAATS